jgi:hypothetical protein
MDVCHGMPLTRQLAASLSVHFMRRSSVVMLHRTARNDVLLGLEPFLTPVSPVLTLDTAVSSGEGWSHGVDMLSDLTVIPEHSRGV